MNCPRCHAPHNEYRLTCRRCGHYLQSIDDAASNVPELPPGVWIVLAVALIGGFACFMLFWPKMQPAPPAAAVQAPAQVESAKSPVTPTKKRGKRRRKAG